MKKKSFKTLRLRKKSISNFSKIILGGADTVPPTFLCGSKSPGSGPTDETNNCTDMCNDTENDTYVGGI
jgi:hypothetical protein